MGEAHYLRSWLQIMRNFRLCLDMTPVCFTYVSGTAFESRCSSVCHNEEFQPAFEVELVGNDRDLARLV